MSPRRAKSNPPESPSAWADRLAESLADRRERAGAFVAEHRRQLDDIEQQIAGEIEILTEELKAESIDQERRDEQLENRHVALEAKADQLAEMQNELTNHQLEFEDFQEKVTAREQALSLREDQLHSRSEDLAEDSSRLEGEAALLEQQRQAEQQQTDENRLHLEDQQRRLETERSELELRESELKSQRRRIARQLRTKKSTLLAEIEQQRASLQHANPVADAKQREQMAQLREETIQDQERFESALLEAKHREEDLKEARDEAESEATAVKVALGQARDDQEEVRRQLAETREQLSLQEAEVARLHEQLQQALSSETHEGDESIQEEIAQLRQQRDDLLNRLEVAEEETQQTASDKIPNVQDEDLRRRFELAVDDVRELKTKNAELERNLEEASSDTALLVSDEGNLDWEAQKKRMLAQLKDEFDDEDEEESKERLSIEGTLRITDQIVLERDHEIADLKRELKESSPSPHDETAVGAKAIAQLLDQDDVIAQERENLKRIQKEWKDKLRKSEVDISLERARLARERAQLEETLHALKQNEEEPSTDNKAKQGKTTSRGRWLTRLGLGSDDDEK